MRRGLFSLMSGLSVITFGETCNTNVVTDKLNSHKNSYFRPNN